MDDVTHIFTLYTCISSMIIVVRFLYNNMECFTYTYGDLTHFIIYLY